MFSFPFRYIPARALYFRVKQFLFIIGNSALVSSSHYPINVICILIQVLLYFSALHANSCLGTLVLAHTACFTDIIVSCITGFGRFGAGGGGGLYSLFPGPGGGGGGGASEASAAIYSQATSAAARFAHSANTYHNFIGAHKGNYDVTAVVIT
jgi:hypothetical protein